MIICIPYIIFSPFWVKNDIGTLHALVTWPHHTHLVGGAFGTNREWRTNGTANGERRTTNGERMTANDKREWRTATGLYLSATVRKRTSLASDDRGHSLSLSRARREDRHVPISSALSEARRCLWRALSLSLVAVPGLQNSLISVSLASSRPVVIIIIIGLRVLEIRYVRQRRIEKSCQLYII